jgi:WD40 repeat protein
MKRLVLGTICIIFLITAYSQAPLAQLEGTVSSSIIKSSSLSSLVSTQVDTGFIFLGRDSEPPHLLRLELLDLPSGKRITSSLSIGLGLSHYSEADMRQSPDGKWIGVKVGSQLFVVDSALQNHIIVPLEAELRSWTWSPDSSSIAILLGADDHNPSLYSFNLESFYLERLDIVRRLGVHKAVRSMAWSPDGSKIILFSSDTGKLMYLVDILANSIEQLPKEEMCGGAIGTVKWSPDGQWIATHFPSWGGRQGAYSRLCAYNLAEKTFFPIEHSIDIITIY